MDHSIYCLGNIWLSFGCHLNIKQIPEETGKINMKVLKNIGGKKVHSWG